MFRIRKKFRFEAAHQLPAAFSTDCMRMHGHSYTVELFLVASFLDEDGMVMDFGKLKGFIESIKAMWDHKIIQNLPKPTAEAMAMTIYEGLALHLKQTEKSCRVRVERVRVHETETGWAEYEEDK